VIEELVQRCERSCDIREVDHPPQVRIDRPAHVQRDLEAVAMQACTLVAFGHVREAMRGF
jgi:hypothetical protein